MHRKFIRKSSEKCWKTTSINMVQTLLKTCKFQLLFFIKIHHKFMKNHQKTRFGNRLGKRYHFLLIFYTFWCHLGTLGSLPGHHFSSKMLRVCRPQALLDAFWWFLHGFYYPWNLWDHFGHHFVSILMLFWKKSGEFLSSVPYNFSKISSCAFRAFFPSSA